LDAWGATVRNLSTIWVDKPVDKMRQDFKTSPNVERCARLPQSAATALSPDCKRRERVKRASYCRDFESHDMGGGQPMSWNSIGDPAVSVASHHCSKVRLVGPTGSWFGDPSRRLWPGWEFSWAITRRHWLVSSDWSIRFSENPYKLYKSFSKIRINRLPEGRRQRPDPEDRTAKV